MKAQTDKTEITVFLKVSFHYLLQSESCERLKLLIMLVKLFPKKWVIFEKIALCVILSFKKF